MKPPKSIMAACCCALAAVSWPLYATQGDAASGELLDPVHAFRLSVHRVASGALEVQFDIADGYYLYRDRFKLMVNGHETRRSDLHWPKGLQLKDPNFGKVVTFRKAVRLRAASLLPANLGKEARTDLEVISQGCADVGVCFPPLRQRVVVNQGEAYAVPVTALPESAQGAAVSGIRTNELVRKAMPR